MSQIIKEETNQTGKSCYIHLPFCKTKCPYCDFASFTDNENDKYQKYFKALINEIQFRSQNLTTRPKLKTIYFGGGTPSIHNGADVKNILAALKKYYDFDQSIEITLEANPGTINQTKLESFLAAGVNRISLGVQTFSEELIGYLARGHTVSEAIEAIKIIKSLAFDSWSLDLIYGLPHQSLEDFSKSIDTALSFDPPHISSYALSIEPNTPFGSIYKDSSHKDLPQEDKVLKMYFLLNKKLEDAGLLRYEISNWASFGQESKHNLCYWLAQEYYAFGLSAHGFVDKKRYANTRNFDDYQERFLNIKAEYTESGFFINQEEILELIDDNKALEEQIFLSLRLKQGLKLNAKIEEKINMAKLNSFCEQGYLSLKNRNLSLNEKALMISNKIIFELIK